MKTERNILKMKKWTVQDRYGNMIYMTEERWNHILESRPELEPFLDEFLETIRTGRRRQDALIPNEYRYYKQFDELLPDNNHLVTVVIFKTRVDDAGNYVRNNFVVTGWAKSIILKR
ncbi:Uncharacterized protein dnm_066870 [Desulfonema magnum]|uniref:Phage-Barnase-EndoU-ColicinE5/D-RelE like nuclease 2 domain-containing protein n=1 Tax=Desulfonema magnum TaxID=45655 RepID=A0A975GR28_9BACT|nr:Uncharacterized protein dnm_066870 [Desulfonema magnum]